MRLPEILAPLRSQLAPLDTPVEMDRELSAAAVACILFPRRNDVRFLLTVRPDTLTRHPGQISLPGGRAEPGDSSLWHTAERETQEELGMRTGRLYPLGRLDPVAVTVSRYQVWPYVAWCPVAPRLRPDPSEVAEVLEVPLLELLDDRNMREEEWDLAGRRRYVAFYSLQGLTVWGATGRILYDLAQRLRGGVFPAHRIPGSVRPAG